MSDCDHIHSRPPALAALLVLVLSLIPGTALAQDDDDPAAEDETVDTSSWRCRLCPFETGWSGSITAGGGYVSEDSFEFGDYTGLEEEGAYPILGGELRYRGENAGYLDLSADNLGLESRSARIEGGRQGSYRLYLEYDSLPHYIADDAQTVFYGARTGSSNLTLPSDWVRGDTTADMTTLDGSLRDVDIEQEREAIGLGAGIKQGDNWRYNLDFRRFTQEGNRVQGGNFLLRSALLVVPVDYVTEQMDASVGYVTDRWQMELAYHGSFFTNNDESVSWDNPYASVTDGDDRGRMSTPPDNSFNQLLLSGAWRPEGGWLSTSARVAYGRMEQNEDFLPATINPAISSPASSRDSLEGRVDTLTANARARAVPWKPLSITGEVYYDERDNRTPRDKYVQIMTDQYIADTRTNKPYGFEKTGASLDADYRLLRRLTLSAGASREDYERTFQEVERTRTDEYSLGLRAGPWANLQLRLRQTREEREAAGDYETLEVMPAENPRLRKYHLADRVRDVTSANLSWSPSAWASIGVSADYAEDDYEESDIGLTGATDMTYGLDVSLVPAEGMTAYAFVSQQRIESDIGGRDNVSGAVWSAELNDNIRSVGIGGEVRDILRDGLDLGLDLTYTRSRGETDVDKRGIAPPFPDLKSDLRSIGLFTRYEVSETTDLRLDYRFEQYRTEDFYYDEVEPDTISNVLTLGRESPDYDVHVIGLSARYRF
ncbi:MtrB/PioB family decaheme-associated outer membrane protein [Ectothiorhodospiraceae bacterium WFHF3C12]|nr:MtrB/PioB family decaheme-associated outer membrane protein [Ectothiorhodospiraceae bacterium WFHF3C12]